MRITQPPTPERGAEAASHYQPIGAFQILEKSWSSKIVADMCLNYFYSDTDPYSW
jgi:hypothetical protein